MDHFEQNKEGRSGEETNASIRQHHEAWASRHDEPPAVAAAKSSSGIPPRALGSKNSASMS